MKIVNKKPNERIKELEEAIEFLIEDSYKAGGSMINLKSMTKLINALQKRKIV